MNAMDKWTVDIDVSFDLDDNGNELTCDPVYVVYHYVGGEDPEVVDDMFDDAQEAEARADELNAMGLQYMFECHEDNCKLRVFNGAGEPCEWL